MYFDFWPLGQVVCTALCLRSCDHIALDTYALEVKLYNDSCLEHHKGRQAC